MKTENNEDLKTISKKYVPIIGIAFTISFLSPTSINPSELPAHLAGIALGFGLAYLVVYISKWRKLNE